MKHWLHWTYYVSSNNSVGTYIVYLCWNLIIMICHFFNFNICGLDCNIANFCLTSHEEYYCCFHDVHKFTNNILGRVNANALWSKTWYISILQQTTTMSCCKWIEFSWKSPDVERWFTTLPEKEFCIWFISGHFCRRCSTQQQRTRPYVLFTRAIKRFALFDLLKSLYSDTNILSKYIPSLQKKL